jgi:hypothetical protein
MEQPLVSTWAQDIYARRGFGFTAPDDAHLRLGRIWSVVPEEIGTDLEEISRQASHRTRGQGCAAYLPQFRDERLAAISA